MTFQQQIVGGSDHAVSVNIADDDRDARIDGDPSDVEPDDVTGADIFVSVTAVPNVYINYGLPEQKPLHQVTAAEIKNLIKYGYFKPGSMLPKVIAAIKFANKSGTGIITDINHLESALSGQAGTIITK